jgi:hypothetical protein
MLRMILGDIHAPKGTRSTVRCRLARRGTAVGDLVVILATRRDARRCSVRVRS